MNTNLYKLRKEQGICVSCGKLALNGKARCDSCLEKIRLNRNREQQHQYEKESYEWYKAHNICPQCGKNRPLNNHVLCLDCIYKSTVRKIGYKPDDEQKEKRYDNAKQKRSERIEAGLCAVCGKPLDYKGYKTCSACRLYKRNKQNEYRSKNGKFHFQQFDESGERICCICGKLAIEDKNYCEEHYKIKLDAIEYARTKRKRDTNNVLISGKLNLIATI